MVVGALYREASRYCFMLRIGLLFSARHFSTKRICTCQTVNDFIGIGGSVCGLFLFVQTHAPLDICEQHTMCLMLCCLVFNICECGFQRSKVVLVLVNDNCALVKTRGSRCRPLSAFLFGSQSVDSASFEPFRSGR